MYNLKAGKHYSLQDDGIQVSHLGSDGNLHYSLNKYLFTYKTASGIKRLYPHLKMINEQTGLEVFK